MYSSYILGYSLRVCLCAPGFYATRGSNYIAQNHTALLADKFNFNFTPLNVTPNTKHFRGLILPRLHLEVYTVISAWVTLILFATLGRSGYVRPYWPLTIEQCGRERYTDIMHVAVGVGREREREISGNKQHWREDRILSSIHPVKGSYFPTVTVIPTCFPSNALSLWRVTMWNDTVVIKHRYEEQ